MFSQTPPFAAANPVFFKGVNKNQADTWLTFRCESYQIRVLLFHWNPVIFTSGLDFVPG